MTAPSVFALDADRDLNLTVLAAAWRRVVLSRRRRTREAGIEPETALHCAVGLLVVGAYVDPDGTVWLGDGLRCSAREWALVLHRVGQVVIRRAARRVVAARARAGAP